MSHTSDDANKSDPEHPLTSLAPIAINNEDALEKGLLLEDQSAGYPITSPTNDLDASALMSSVGPNEHIIPENSATLEPPKEIKPIRRDTRPLSPDQQTLLQSPLPRQGVSLDPAGKAVGNAPQDLQSDIPASLDQYTAFWKAYNDDADAQDKEIVESLGGDLDALLIFAGLFSASNVAFIVEAYKDLKQDNVDTTNDLLRTLIHNQISPSNPLAAESSRFTVTPRAIRVNALFFTSLSCSLLTALGAVLGKQWLNHYKREGRRMTLAERGRERQTKYMGLERWHLEQVVETLPTLLQFSLFLFLGALIDFLWSINRTIAGVIAGFSIITFCFYVMTTTIAVLFPSAPFQTRFSALVRTSRISFLRFLTWIEESALVVSLRLRCKVYWTQLSTFFVRRTSHQSHTIAPSLRVRTPTVTPSLPYIVPPSLQYDRASDDLSARVVPITSPQPITVRGRISELFGNIGKLLKRLPSSSPQGPVDNVGFVLSKDDLSCKCIAWVLETSSIDKTLSLAATAALMLPERGWEKIDTLDEIPRILRLVLGARAFESKVILDAQPGTVKAVLEPLHALIMKWDHTTELVVPTLGDNNSFVMNLEHLLWRVVRAYPVEGMAAVRILEMLVKLEFSIEPRQEEIDSLYRCALQDPGSDPDLAIVLGFLVLLESSLSFASIEQFLGNNTSFGFWGIARMLQPLHGSILLTDGSRFLRVAHPSLRSFFADPTRCQNPNITTSTSRHTTLALNCVELMTIRLKRNILGADSRLLLNKDIVDLESKLTDVGVSESLQYACRHWATHLQFSSRRDPKLRDAMKEFCTITMLPWLEVMSLLGCYDEAASMIGRAETWMRLGDSSNVTTDLLHDMHRFIMLFEGPVKLSAEAIYSVALPLASPSELHTHYHKQTPSVKIRPEGPINLWTSTSKVVSPHVNEAAAVAVSHDNRYILFGADDGMVQLFTMRDGKCIAKFEGHKSCVQSAVFAPDNNIIVSGSWDRTIKVWDVSTRSLRFTLVGHRGWIRAVSVSPDSKYIISGGDDQTIRLWDASTGSHIATMEGHQDLVWAVIFSPDGHKILSASVGGALRIWNTADRTLLGTLDHSTNVISVTFSSDGQRIASGGGGNMVRIWDTESQVLVHTLEGHMGRISSLAFSPDTRFIATGSDAGMIRVWDILEGSVQTTLEGHTDWIDNISFTPDQRYIVSASRDSSVRTWNWEDAESSSIKISMGHASQIAAIAFCSNGSMLASGGDNGEVHIWNVDDMAHVVRLDGFLESVESITFSSDGEYITVSSLGLTTRWDLNTHQIISSSTSSNTQQIISSSTSSDLSLHSSSENSIEYGPGEVPYNPAVEYRLALESGTLYAKKFSTGKEMCSKELLTLPVPNISASEAHGFLLAVGTKAGQIMILDFSSVISFETIFDEGATHHKTEIQGSVIDSVILRSPSSSAF